MVAPQSDPSDPSQDDPAVSGRKRRANRRNVRRSTGPRSPEGKARSARNATTHGLFCRDAVLSGESDAEFRLLRQSFIRKLNPQDLVELSLVEQIVHANWRLIRCRDAEGIFLTGLGAQGAELARNAVEHLKEQYDLDFASNKEDIVLMRKVSSLELAAAAGYEMPAAANFTIAMMDPDKPLERYGRYELRLQQTIHRCLRELSDLRGEKCRADGTDLPPSPYFEPMTQFEPDGNEQDDAPECHEMPHPSSHAQNEATAVQPLASHAPAEPCAQQQPPIPPPSDLNQAVNNVVQDLIRLREEARFEDQEE